MKTIIAQTGAGKTTYCRTHKWCIDGDNLSEVQHVYSTLSGKYGKDWLTTGFQAIEPEYIRMMRDVERKLSGRNIWVAISTTIFATSTSIFVIPDPGVVREQLSKPRPNHDPSHDQQRAQWADADRKVYISAARRLKALVFKSFNDLDTANVLS